MIRLYQAHTTLLVSFDHNDNLNQIDIRHLLKQMVLKLKVPLTNIMVDLKGIKEIDDKGLNVLLLGKKLSEMSNSQISIFNVKSEVLLQIRKKRYYRNFFFCDELSMAS